MTRVELRKLVEAMTPAPWFGASVPSGRKYGVIGVKDEKGSHPVAVLSGVPTKHRHADTQGIVALRNAASDLLDEIDRLRDGLLTIGTRCTHYTGKSTCVENRPDGRGGEYGAENWCEGCIAREALK